MVTYKEVLGINAAEFIAKGVEIGYTEIDKAMGRSALAPHLRPSTWLNIIGGAIVQIGALYARVRSPWDIILVSAGAHNETQIVDYLMEYLAPTAPLAARVTYKPGVGVTPTTTVPKLKGVTPSLQPQVGLDHSFGYREVVGPSYDTTPYPS